MYDTLSHTYSFTIHIFTVSYTTHSIYVFIHVKYIYANIHNIVSDIPSRTFSLFVLHVLYMTRWNIFISNFVSGLPSSDHDENFQSYKTQSK